MKTLIISDTHGFHKDLNVPEVDMVIHCGDCSNYREKSFNDAEVREFLDWYEKVPAKHKIYVPGNHDTSIEAGFYTKEDFALRGIHLLIHDSVKINGLRIFGSPYTPTFGNWAYMKSRNNLHSYWQEIPEDTDILVTHGPPKTVLDLSYNPSNQLEFCGDNALLKRVKEMNIKYHCFGHIHDRDDILNYGTRTIEGCSTTFVNATLVLDGRWDKGLIHEGHIVEIQVNEEI